MPSKAAGTPEVDRIIGALARRDICPERGEMVPLAYTRAALAKETGISFSDLAPHLQRLMGLGYVRTRVHRPSGRTLYKLSDNAQQLLN